jgi:hypothetical protein
MPDKPDPTTPQVTSAEDEFRQLAEDAQPGLLREFWDFLRFNKKWWLLPILITLAVLGLFVLLSGTAFAPFIYTLY